MSDENNPVARAGILFTVVAPALAAEPLKVGDTRRTSRWSAATARRTSWRTSKGKSRRRRLVSAGLHGRLHEGVQVVQGTRGKIREYDVAYFTASNDPAEKNKEFAESLSVDYPILSDPDSRVASRYGVSTEREGGPAMDVSISGPTARSGTSTNP